jgi:rhodanese-related sulfurtransferase
MSRFLSILGAILAIPASMWAAEHTTDSLDTVKTAVAQNKAVLVDVRETDEWKDGHLKDAKHIALSDLKKGVAADRLKMNLPAGSVVYLHCAAGGRCKMAADYLKKLGYDARPLKDGYDSLVRAGFEKSK